MPCWNRASNAATGRAAYIQVMETGRVEAAMILFFVISQPCQSSTIKKRATSTSTT